MNDEKSRSDFIKFARTSGRLDLQLEFDVDDGHISATELARIILNVQRQTTALTLVATSEMWYDWAREGLFADPSSQFHSVESATYQSFISERGAPLEGPEFLFARAEIVGIRMESPLTVRALLFLPDWATKLVREALAFIYTRFYFGDLDRERKSLENDALRQQVIAQKIKNLEETLELERRFPGPWAKEIVRVHLLSSVLEFDPDFTRHTFKKHRLVAGTVSDPNAPEDVTSTVSRR
jgi:hypothetical protein